MQPKDSNNNLADRRSLFLSSADVDTSIKVDKWTRCINTPTITEKYQYMSLISAVIQNNIYTVQEEVNDHIFCSFTWYECINPAKENWGDKSNQIGPFYTVYDIKLDQRKYTGKELIKILNDKLLRLDFQMASKRNPYPIDEDEIGNDRFIRKPDNGNDIIHFMDTSENRLEFEYKIISHYGKLYFTSFDIVFPDLSYKLFGVDGNSKTISMYHTEHQENAYFYKTFENHLVQLPNQPSLIWCTFIQIRCDWVNSGENSMVLANIPITDINSEYITYTNPQVEWTAKKMQYHEYQRMNLRLSQEDGYAIDIKNIPFYFEVILY